MSLGTRIKDLREELGLTQIAFAKILNISNSTLSQYENGDRVPSDATKIKIADYFDVSLDYLLGRSSVRKPTPVSKDGPNKQNEMDRRLISYVNQMTPEQKALLLALLQTTVAHNEDMPVPGQLSIGETAPEFARLSQT